MRSPTIKVARTERVNDAGEISSRLRIPTISWRTLGILLPFAALFITLSVASKPFLTKTNLINLLGQQSSTLIIAAASTLVIISGGLDLSVGATYALAAVVAGEVLKSHPLALGVLAGLGAGLVVGLLNGVVSTVFKINSLIATLAMSFIVEGAAGRITSGNLIQITNQNFSNLANKMLWTVPLIVWITAVIVVALAVFLARTVPGRHMYASGGNPEAARLAGVRVGVIRVIAFALTGVAAAVGGILDTSRVLTAQASNGGSSLTFTVLAGVVVGGTSIAGGEGAVWRTVVGVLFIALINNGFDLLGVDPLYQQMVLGLILLLAVGLDSWARASTRRRLSGALTSTLRTLRLTGPSGELLPEGAPAVAEGEGSVSAGASTKGSG